MRRDWDQRARENPFYYVNTARSSWSLEEFFASGEQTVADEILTDMSNICQGLDPKEMRVLEIGCGAGRVTRALARLFGEVWAVDVSGEMVRLARELLADLPNVHILQNNGFDLSVLPPLRFDFAFSTIVFQHIPSKRVIESYLREVHRLLRPGKLFKFQVQGYPDFERPPNDTWLGVPLTKQEAIELALRTGFEPRYFRGEGTQEFWLWFFRRSRLRQRLLYYGWRLAASLSRPAASPPA